MDFKEEQLMEVEALESIYTSELTVESTEPYHSFRFDLTSQDIKDNPLDGVTVTLHFTYTEKYPEELPLMEIEDSSENLERHRHELLELMQTTAEESLGMVSVFTVVSAVQERLNEAADQNEKDREEEAERKKQEEEEKDRKKFEGTRCTVENFIAWKTKFDAEMKEIKKQRGLLEEASNKLTGYELFMSDATLKDSDIGFLEEEFERVEVDDSLFEDMEDLDAELA